MSQTLKIFLAFILTIILAIVFTPFLGGLYDKFFPVSGGFFWGPSHPEYIPGFIVAYMFSFPLFFISLLEKRRIMWLSIGILPVIVLILLAKEGNTLIVGGVLFILGSLLGLLASKLANIGEKK